MVELIWDGKYDSNGKRTAPPRLKLPFQTVETINGVHHLIETNGREDVDVAHKDRTARLWCENATLLTGREWRYKKIPQKEFEELRPDDFDDLIALEPVRLL